jgi:sugar/nucleoside kinase (ribokinase family)
MLGLLDFISPNETELERLLADLNIKTSEELVKKFPNLKLLIKLGERGCLLIGSQGFEEVRVSSVT